MSAYDSFAPIYDQYAAAMTEDVDFYASLATEAEGPVVELAVGTGRVAVPIAVRTGKRVIGIDSSQAMLDAAAANAATAGVVFELRLADMRDFELGESTDLVICPARSLLHVQGHARRLEVFRRVAALLRPGGRFAWNAFVFDPDVASEFDGKWREQGGVHHLIRYDYHERRVDLTLQNGALLQLWWANPEEWDLLVAESGLEVEARYGWFDRRPFDDSSREAIYVTRKP